MLLNFLIWTCIDGWATASLFGMAHVSKFRKEERKEKRGKGNDGRKEGGKKIKRIPKRVHG